MINMLCMIFSELCPVYSKPVGPPQQQQRPRYPGYPSNGGPGYPTQNMGGMPQPSYPGQIPPAYSQGGQQPYGSYPNQTPYPSTTPLTSYSQQQQQTTTSPPARPPPPAAQRQDSVINNDTLRLSLLSTAEDKIKRRVKEVFQMGQVCNLTLFCAK